MKATSIQPLLSRRQAKAAPAAGWKKLLMDRIRECNYKTVARELDVSRSIIWLLVKDGDATPADWLKRRIVTIYGPKAGIECPIFGTVTPLKCADHFRRAWTKGTAPDDLTEQRRSQCRSCGKRL